MCPNTPVFGYDERNNDIGILIVRRSDGTSLAIGSTCDACLPGVVQRPLTDPLLSLQTVLEALDHQMLQTPECAVFAF
jgi:hypothetical protein